MTKHDYKYQIGDLLQSRWHPSKYVLIVAYGLKGNEEKFPAYLVLQISDMGARKVLLTETFILGQYAPT